MSLAGFRVAGDGPLFEAVLILNRVADGAHARVSVLTGDSIQINRI